MEIDIRYLNRNLDFTARENGDAIKGSGIVNLLRAVERRKGNIKRISLEGKTTSFTFMRQVYLLANSLRYFSGAKLIIGGREIKGIALPEYTP